MLTLPILLLPLYVSWRVARALAIEPAAARWSAVGVLWSASLAALFAGLLALESFRPLPACALILCLTGLAHLVLGSPERDDWQSERRAVRAWLASLGPAARAVAMLLVFPAAGLVVRSLLLPPLAWDDLTYHVFFSASWVQEGRAVLFSFPDGMDGYSHFPKLGEAIAAWWILPFGNDLLYGAHNLPFWLQLGVAVYGLARELDADAMTASLAAAVLCFSPVVYSHYPTSHLALLLCAAVSTGALFTLRYLRSRSGVDLVLAMLALGLAVGAKHNAVVFVAPIAAVAGVAGLANWLRGPKAQATAALAAALLCFLAFGLPQYASNWLDAGNPFYPLPLRFAGHEIQPASDYIRWVGENTDPSRLHPEFEWLRFMFSLERRAAGPALGLLLLLAIPAVFTAPVGRRPAAWLVTGWWMVPVLIFCLDQSSNTVSVRRSWPHDVTRLLLPALCLSSALATSWIARQTRARTWVCAGVLALVGAGLLIDGSDSPGFWPTTAGIAWLLLAAALAGVAARSNVRSRRFATTGLLVVVLAAAIPAIAAYRERTRWDLLGRTVTIGDFPRELVPGWEFLDTPDTPHTVAITVGREWPGHGWFLYPLMGSALQNRVVYVSTSQRGVRPTHESRGAMRKDADESIWRANLVALGVDRLFVQAPWPKEIEWIEAAPDEFERLRSDDAYRIYRVAPR